MTICWKFCHWTCKVKEISNIRWRVVQFAWKSARFFVRNLNSEMKRELNSAVNNNHQCCEPSKAAQWNKNKVSLVTARANVKLLLLFRPKCHVLRLIHVACNQFINSMNFLSFSFQSPNFLLPCLSCNCMLFHLCNHFNSLMFATDKEGRWDFNWLF